MSDARWIEAIGYARQLAAELPAAIAAFRQGIDP